MGKMRSGTILAAALVAFSVSSVDAQVVGVKGGVNFADLSIDEEGGSVDTETHGGLIGGVFASFSLGDVFALRPELLLSQKGAEATEGEESASLELTYLEIPVFLSASTTAGRLRPSVYAGPVISFETGCTLELESGETELSTPCEDGSEEDVLTKSTDLGLAFGVGLSYETGNVVWLLDGRYTLGLTDINDVSDAPESFKNRVFSIMGGVGIRLN